LRKRIIHRILIIQTASIGDVTLATPLIEKLSDFFPKAKIDFLLKKGIESLLNGHPMLNRVIVFDKSNKKFENI
jgi:ADP-heptose:LPS heptosyltransferase